MPPFSTTIQEEGVHINNVKLVSEGVLQEQDMLALLASGKYPSRNPQQNMADLRAQLAANEKACKSCTKWWPSLVWMWCRPICVMCKTMPKNLCAA
jgi:5-oxoprolinase (ATP-hydrolysing)